MTHKYNLEAELTETLSQPAKQYKAYCLHSDTHGPCGAEIVLSPEAVERWAASNRALASRGEPPLSPREVAVCPEHVQHWRELKGESVRHEWAEERRRLMDRERTKE